MFAFHKPRVYRSAEGCCICRAKSSSSRFTDSKKYEEDSIKCFDLKEPRQGEICNACVLLVKRYKRLPIGSNRHWGHVVDARAGPGMKSMTKCKKLKEESTHHSSNSSSDRNHHNQKSLIPEKFSKIFKKNKKKQSKDKIKSQHTAMSSKTWESQSLPLTPESLDSDCDDVQYSPTSAIESASLKIRQAINRRGSNKRKCLPPKKFRSSNMDNVQFFDENLWVKRKSCCGIVFENKQLGAIILDLENHIPCAEHRRKRVDVAAKTTVQQSSNQQQYNTKSASHQISFNPPANRNPTPVLKKHHLFFKRQSENFPLGDMKQLNNTANPSKTDFVLDIKVLPTTIPTSSAVKVAKLNPVDSGLLNGGTHLPTTSAKALAAAAAASPTAYDQQHQTVHKAPSNKANSFLHKVKSDTGKIVKHSLEKLSTLRLKPSELNDVHNMVKTVDKSFLIKPVVTAVSTTTATTAAAAISTTTIVAQEKVKKSPTDTPPGGTSTQPVATKFNDNSSDSGFDENLQDRKSVSPLDEGEKKVMTIPVQTMYLASGVQIHGQHQNLLLAGNDVAAKILQTRKQMQNSRNGVKIAQLVTGGGITHKMHTLYSQQPSQDGAIMTSGPSTSAAASSANIITIPSTSCTTAPSSHLSKASATNIILSGSGSNGSSNIISTSSMQSLNQKIILVKTKYNSNNNNNQSTCKN